MAIRGDGSVFQRKDTGNWQVRVPYPGGKIDRCGGRTRKQADMKRKKLVVCREDGVAREDALHRVFSDARPDAYSLSDIKDAYVEAASQEKSPATMRNERLRLAQLAKSKLGTVALSGLTLSAVQEYLRGRIKNRVTEVRAKLPAHLDADEREIQSEIAKAKAKKTCNRFVAVLSSVCRYAEDEGVLPPGFWSRLAVKRFSEQIGDVGVYLTAGEVDASVAAMPAWLAPLVDFAASLGLRRGEIIALRWRHLDFQARTVTVEWGRGKSKVERVLKMPLRIFGLLRRLREQRGDVLPSDPVFLDRSGKAIKADTLTQAFQRVMAKAPKGVDAAKATAMRFHDLRHSAASLMLTGGASIYEVRDALGHASVTTTERYAKFVPQAADNAARAMDRARALGVLSG